MNILSIGGSDPSSAAGVQRDARIAWSMGMYHLSVVTAMTAQNTSEFMGVWPVGGRAVEQQLDAVNSDFEISAIKVGMLWNAGVVNIVADFLRTTSAPVVLDPVVCSTTGGSLIEDSALRVMLDCVVPLADVITPNMAEAEYLTGMVVHDIESARAAARMLCDIGAAATVVTGVVSGHTVTDVFYDGRFCNMAGQRLDTRHRGGGCSFSMAVACQMAAGNGAAESVSLAHDTIYTSILKSVSPGAGRRVAADPWASQLVRAIDRLTDITHIADIIPQCQTNFVHAPVDSVSPDQVLGIKGRIVRTGNSAIRTGVVVQGGSRHVASAVCAMRARFPDILSAVNIKYSPEVISAIIKEGLTVAFYDRNQEPPDIKESGSSVAWGVSEAVSGLDIAPDAVCHRGDFGKEPMTIIFGLDPDEVISKVRRILTHLHQ